MKNLFVKYRIALLLKEAGFNEACFAYFCCNVFMVTNNVPKFRYWVIIDDAETNCKNTDITFQEKDCTSPLYQQVIDWFTEKHGLQLFPTYPYSDGFHYGFKWVNSSGEVGEYWRDNGDECKGCDTLVEAYIEAIEESLKKVQSVKTKIKDLCQGDMFEYLDNEFTVFKIYSDWRCDGMPYLETSNEGGIFYSGELVVSKIKQ